MVRSWKHVQQTDVSKNRAVKRKKDSYEEVWMKMCFVVTHW
jgi:hypothetical protein